MNDFGLEYTLKRVQQLEKTLKDQKDERDEYFKLIRRAKLQNVRAKEKAIERLKQMDLDPNLKDMLEMLLGESRRSDLQIVSYSENILGLKYNKNRRKNKRRKQKP